MNVLGRALDPIKLVKWYAAFVAATGAIWKATEIYKRNFSDQWEEHIRRHSTVEELVEDRLWKVSGTFYAVPNFRNMFVYRMNDRKLMFYSPLVLPDSDMTIFEELGEPSVIVVPNASAESTVDVGVFRSRYPEAKFIAPAEAFPSLQEKSIAVDETTEDFFASRKDLNISLIKPPLKQFHENIYDIPLDNNERALLAGTLISNCKTTWGVRPKLLWLMGYGTDGLQPDVPAAIRTNGVKSMHHLHVFLARLSGELEKKKDSYRLVLPQHGQVMDTDLYKRFRKLSEVYK